MADKHESQCCVVCLEEGPTYYFAPCNHKCVCENCAKEYITKAEAIYTRCPVCRRAFDSITADITSSMTPVGTEEEDAEEDNQLQIACALSHSEFVNQIQNDMLQEQADLCMAIEASKAEVRTPPTGTANLSEDEMVQIACALSVSEAVPMQEPLETIDLTQDEMLKTPSAPTPKPIRLTFSSRVKIKAALFIARAFRIKS